MYELRMCGCFCYVYSQNHVKFADSAAWGTCTPTHPLCTVCLSISLPTPTAIILWNPTKYLYYITLPYVHNTVQKLFLRGFHSTEIVHAKKFSRSRPPLITTACDGARSCCQDTILLLVRAKSVKKSVYFQVFRPLQVVILFLVRASP